MNRLHWDYDDYWPVAFAEEAYRLQTLLGPLALRVDHVGSTSIVGMIGKPVIDIQISMHSLVHLEDLICRIENCGYTHVRLLEPPVTEYPFFFRPAYWPHAYQLHLCRAGGDQEWRHLAFRDWLREHPEDRQKYSELKTRQAVGVDPSDPFSLLRYSQGKGQFVQHIEGRLREQARLQSESSGN